MARKFSNLFISLLELAMEENGGRVRHIYEEKYGIREKEPIIISNRALAFMKPKIVNGEIKKILLADDIIIHGRTLNKVYEQLRSWFEDAGIQELIDILDDVIEQNLDGSEHPARNWVSGDKQKEVLQAVMGKFLVENGRLDEERCRNSQLERNVGMPLYSLIHKLLEKFQSEKSIFASILYAIDFGKGSIAAKKYGNYYVSFIHAGEQNYKYYENHYFPFLYGLYRLETAGLHMGIPTVENKKNEFINEYLQYWKQEQLYYLDTDINYIKEISVEAEYDKVLLYDLLDYAQNPHLQYTIKLVQQKVMEL